MSGAAGRPVEQRGDLLGSRRVGPRDHRGQFDALHAKDATASLPAMARPRTPAGRARVTNQRLARLYPGSADDCARSTTRDPFQLLVATILSAQCTDERVNLTTPALFARYPDAESLAAADLSEVEELIRSTGFFRAKARNLVGMAEAVVDRFGGEVPSAMADLVTLPGVGRKTANVVRSVAFGLPGLPVDTHVQRLSLRLGSPRRPTRSRSSGRSTDGAGRPAGGVQPAADPARPGHLHGPTPTVRRACSPTSVRRPPWSGARRIVA